MAGPVKHPTDDECREADNSPITSWKELHSYFRKYGGFCADGAQAEGLAEVAAELLDEKWSTLSELHALSRRDPAFLRWILSRPIYSPEDHAVAERALHNLTNNCTKPHLALCQRLASRVVTTF